jgi:hypothetical protein
MVQLHRFDRGKILKRLVLGSAPGIMMAISQDLLPAIHILGIQTPALIQILATSSEEREVIILDLDLIVISDATFTGKDIVINVIPTRPIINRMSLNIAPKNAELER